MNPLRFAEALLADGDREALWSAGGAWTRNELLAHAQGFIAWARATAPGGRIALAMENGPHLAAAYVGALLGGVPIVPLGPALPARDRDYITTTARVAAVVERPAWGALTPDPAGWSADDDAQQPWAVFFTSGTTGRPKGVCHRRSALLACAAAFNARTGLDASVRMLHVMPMTYMAGFLNTLLCPLLAGGAVVLGEQFNAQHALALWPAAQRGAANAAWFTPTMAALLARLNRDPAVAAWTRATLKQVFVGTAPLPGDTAARFAQVFGVPCLESYGLSELLFISANAPADNVPGSVGLLLDGVGARSAAAAAGGGDGQIEVATPYAMLGYLDPESGLAQPAAEWFPTGDLGALGGDARLRITGRLKDLIIKGGTNVSPRAIEEVMLAIPGVSDVAVVGRPHPFWGEEPVAFVVADESMRDKAALLARCAGAIGRDALPADVRFTAALPRSSNGKILKSVLRESL